MRILLDVSSITHPLSGIGRYALELARHLPDQAGVEEVLYLRGNRVSSRFDPGDIEPVEPSARWRQLARNLVPYGLVLGPYRSLKARRLARDLLPYADYLYHSPNFAVPPLAGRSVATLHDLSVFHWPQYHPRDRVNYLREQIRLSVERADHIVTDSAFVRSEVMELFRLGPEQVTAVPLGVDPAFRPRSIEELTPVLARFGLSPGEYILNVGTLEPRKNLPALLHAFGELEVSRRRRFPLVIAGAYGWRSESLKAVIADLQSRGEIRYLDYVPEEDLPHLYAGCALFCYPSVYEGFGLPVLEAMSSGIPVLCADTSALSELCPGIGSRVAPEDLPGLSAALARALEDPAWRTLVGRQGREASQQYTWRRTARELVRVFEGLGA